MIEKNVLNGSDMCRIDHMPIFKMAFEWELKGKRQKTVISWKQCIHQTMRDLDITTEDVQNKGRLGLSSMEREIYYVFGWDRPLLLNILMIMNTRRFIQNSKSLNPSFTPLSRQLIIGNYLKYTGLIKFTIILYIYIYIYIYTYTSYQKETFRKA